MSQITKESSHCDVHLHAEIVELRHVLSLRDQHIEALESTCLRETDRLAELQTTLGVWQEKYERLYDSHKRIQKVNQNLEDKLLRLVDRGASERAQLTSDVATLSVRLAQANYTITSLQREVERYKSDMSLAIQLIQCKPDNFIPQKLNSLPLDVQSKVAAYMRLDMDGSSAPGTPGSEHQSASASPLHHPDHAHRGHQHHLHGHQAVGGDGGVGDYKMIPSSSDRESPMAALCPFPPTAMVYSMRGYDTDGDSYTNDDVNVSASIVAKVLEDGIKESTMATLHHCDTCRCPPTTSKDLNLLVVDPAPHRYSVATQTYHRHDSYRHHRRLIEDTSEEANLNDDNPILLHCLRCSSRLPCEPDSVDDSFPGISRRRTADEDFISFDASAAATNGGLGHHRLCRKKGTAAGTNKDDLLTDSGDVLIDIEGVVGCTTTSGVNKSDRSVADSKCRSLSRASESSSKLFENFNRTLIESIKTENPKSCGGPRLCSLRIQDGSTNVLVNKSENNMAPVLYTRRKLDLETEITSRTHQNYSNNNNNHHNQNNSSNRYSYYHGNHNNNSSIISDILRMNKNDAEKVRLFDNHLHETSTNGIQTTNRDSGINLSDDNTYGVTSESVNDNPTSTTHGEDGDANAATAVNNNSEQAEKQTTANSDDRHSASGSSSSSRSQSSSMSSAELRESAQLLRQQLHRVAEWVNANADMENRRRAAGGSSDDSEESHRNRSKSSYKSHVRAVKKITHVAASDAHKATRNNNVDNNKVVVGNEVPVNVIDREMTDLEQMEYNVKQFLLRQNEWSVSTANGKV